MPPLAAGLFAAGLHTRLWICEKEKSDVDVNVARKTQLISERQ